jgi:NAD(P)H dehydrogenase (quinone)
MVATEDIGRTAAELIQQNWTGKRLVELEGTPGRMSGHQSFSHAQSCGEPYIPVINHG